MEDVIADVLSTLPEAPPCLVPQVQGMTSPKVRALLNRLVARLPADECYVEVGCHQGATLISALLDNRSATAHACDNWSEFGGEGARGRFLANLEAHKERLPKVVVHEEDCFALAARHPFPKPIGIFFYDGNHSLEAQLKAVTEFAPFFARKAILLVDDWNSDPVRVGTWQGISRLRFRHASFRELPAAFNGDTANWWNGVGAFHLQG